MRTQTWAMGVAIGMLLSCGPPSPSSSGSGDSESSDSESGDGDGEPAYCDLTTLPAIEPIWELTLYGSSERVVMNSDALFVAIYGMWATEPSWIYEFDLGGQEGGSGAWDLGYFYDVTATDEYLYYGVDGSQIRRRDLDGILDDWAIAIPDGFKVNGITIGAADRVLIYGEQDTEGSTDDAAVALFDSSGALIATDSFGDPMSNERVTTATAGSNGGFYFAYGTETAAVIRSYDLAPEFTAELPFGGYPSIGLIVERPDGLVVATLDGGAWVSKLDFAGTEVWRRELRPCGVAGRSLDVVSAGDRMWGLIGVPSSPTDSSTRVVVQIDFEGQLLSTDNAFIGTNLGPQSIASNGEAVILRSGSDYYVTGLARLR